MPLEPPGVLLIGGLVLALGFAVNFLLRRLGAPDILFLLLVGLLLGPGLGWLDRGSMLDLSPLASSLALAVIFLDAGLALRPHEAPGSALRGVLLAVLGLFFSATAVALATVLLLGWPPLLGVLLGLVVAPTGAVVVLAVLRQLRVKRDLQALLTFETSLNGPLAILGVLVLLDFMASRDPSPAHIATAVLAPLFAGALLGAGVGVLLSLTFGRLKRQPYFYTLLLASALATFGAAGTLGASGPVAVLALGFALGNPGSILRRLRLRRTADIDSAVQAYHAEVVFLVRSFFFVLLGTLVMVSDARNLLWGVLLTLLLLASRWPAVALATLRSPMRQGRLLASMMVPKGISTAVLITLLLSFSTGHPGVLPATVAGTLSDLGFSVILASISVAVVGAFLAARVGRVPTGPAGEASEEPANLLRRGAMEAAFEWWRKQ